MIRTQMVMARITDALRPYSEWPKYNRWIAGLYELLWTRYCGYEWKFALRMACIYWLTKPARGVK